jgi:hypothetical protein
VFVRVSGNLGIDIIRLGRSDPTTGSKVMSEDLLDAPETHAVWSKDFCDQIKFVMLLKYGYRLRHRVAHGQITPAECNHYNVSLVLSMLMRIAVTVIPIDPYASIKQYLNKADGEEAKTEAATDIKPSDEPVA